MNKTNQINPKNILEKVYSSIDGLSSKGVQVMFLSNGVSVTVEFSAFRETLKTVSIILFPGDQEKKEEFLDSTMKEILDLEGDAYEAVEKAIKAYNEQFPF